MSLKGESAGVTPDLDRLAHALGIDPEDEPTEGTNGKVAEPEPRLQILLDTFRRQPLRTDEMRELLNLLPEANVPSRRDKSEPIITKEELAQRKIGQSVRQRAALEAAVRAELEPDATD